MKSATLPSFWDEYQSLDKQVRQSARKAYRLWKENPFYPSLHFKCINNQENILSVRITRNYRAIGVLDDDTVTWFWIGNHDDYENFFS
ncbi:MAG: hypothetical protein PT119_25295 [Aphanizomenon gracile PMC627.10]|nr:hypothetical protein [Aphanizomenon gracile PMC627.10]